MPYRYKVRIEASGAKGQNGVSLSTVSLGGKGAKIDVEYEVLPEGIRTDSSGNIVWQLKYRRIEGGSGGISRGSHGADGGDGVEVLLRGGFIVAIAGGGGGGSGIGGFGSKFAGGYAAPQLARDEQNYWRVTGGGGGMASSGYYRALGGSGVGGSGGSWTSDNDTSYDGDAGVDHGVGVDGIPFGGQGGDGGSYVCGGGGGGGGWGGGGGGYSDFFSGGGGGGGGSIIWNNENDALIGFKCVDKSSIFQTGTTSIQENTSTSASLKFTSYKSSNDGTTWSVQKTETISTISTTSEDIDILLNNVPVFNTITPNAVDIVSDQRYTWDLTLKSGTYDGDEQYSIFQSPGTYSPFTTGSSNPSATITTGGVNRGTVTYYVSTGKLTFDGSGLEHDVTSNFQLWVKDPSTPSDSSGNASTSINVTQHKRLLKHETRKTFTASPPIENTGLITTNGRASGVDIATLFQPKSFLNFEHTSTIGGKFFNSSSDLSGVFGEYKSDYSGNDIIDTDTGFKIGGTDIRHIYAAKNPILDIFDTTPGTRNYRFTLPQATEALLICVGGGGGGNGQGSSSASGGQGAGGDGGNIIIQEITMSAGNHELSITVGAGQAGTSSVRAIQKGGDSSIKGNTLDYDTANASQLSVVGYNNNRGGKVYSGSAQDGGFRLEYPDGVTYDIGGGGGAYPLGNGYYGGANGGNATATALGFGGGGGGVSNPYTGSSGRSGLCAILFKP